MLSNLKIAGPSETRNAHMVITYLSALPAAGFIFADVGCVDWIEWTKGDCSYCGEYFGDIRVYVDVCCEMAAVLAGSGGEETEEAC